jgi:hypothetical protein
MSGPRLGLVGLVLLAAVAFLAFGSAAFNYAQVGGRSDAMAIVADNGNAIINIANQDSAYSCNVQFDATNGTVSLHWDGSGSCSGGASGLNTNTLYYFENLLSITNKGQKAWQGLWVNSTDSHVLVNLTYSTDATMTTGSTFAQNDGFVSTVGIGSSVYAGLSINTVNQNKGTWTTYLTFQARASS